MLIIEFVPRNPEGGTNNLLPCPIAFMGNYSDAACEIPATWPVGDSFSSEHVSGVQVCESRGLMAVYAAPTLMTAPIRRNAAAQPAGRTHRPRPPCLAEGLIIGISCSHSGSVTPR